MSTPPSQLRERVLTAHESLASRIQQVPALTANMEPWNV
jgi:hypothetical protein